MCGPHRGSMINHLLFDMYGCTRGSALSSVHATPVSNDDRGQRSRNADPGPTRYPSSHLVHHRTRWHDEVLVDRTGSALLMPSSIGCLTMAPNHRHGLAAAKLVGWVRCSMCRGLGNIAPLHRVSQHSASLSPPATAGASGSSLGRPSAHPSPHTRPSSIGVRRHLPWGGSLITIM